MFSKKIETQTICYQSLQFSTRWRVIGATSHERQEWNQNLFELTHSSEIVLWGIDNAMVKTKRQKTNNGLQTTSQKT